MPSLPGARYGLGPSLSLHPICHPSRSQEMFIRLGKALDRELDEIVPMLLKKAGEVSNAGEVWKGVEDVPWINVQHRWKQCSRLLAHPAAKR